MQAIEATFHAFTIHLLRGYWNPHLCWYSLIKKWIYIGENCSLDRLSCMTVFKWPSHRCTCSKPWSYKISGLAETEITWYSHTHFYFFILLCPYGIMLHLMSCLMSVLDTDHKHQNNSVTACHRGWHIVGVLQMFEWTPCLFSPFPFL